VTKFDITGKELPVGTVLLPSSVAGPAGDDCQRCAIDGSDHHRLEEVVGDTVGCSLRARRSTNWHSR
jgi:hypothetical protein